MWSCVARGSRYALQFGITHDASQISSSLGMSAARWFSQPFATGVHREASTVGAMCVVRGRNGESRRRNYATQSVGTKLDGVKHVIAVASGKGGVGKSTTAVNIALALAHSEKLRVGIMDADVFGPSLPRLMNLKGKPYVTEDKLMQPLENYGVRCISMGFLMEERDAAVWRGPMVMGAVEKLLKGVDWGPLDVIVVDMPPGTGDAHISLSQKVQLSGAVIVSTPQDLALIDARRGVAMYEKVRVPIFGIVENMSHYICPSCGSTAHIFGNGGAQREAKELGVELLGQVPLQMQIRELSDAGKPIVLSKPDSDAAAVYRHIASRIVAMLQKAEQRGPPVIKLD